MHSAPSDPPTGAAGTLALFERLIELDANARAERLAEIGGADPATRRALEELLAADAEAESRLARLERAFAASPEPDMDPAERADPLRLIGRTVAHFRIDSTLAYGGMGVVYRAEDLQLARTVALKFPLPSTPIERGARARLLEEARLAATLDHPNVCAIYEAGETSDGNVFLAMPLYGGETLKSRLAHAGALPVEDALDIARQIALGLAAAHRTGVVHRDLKPGNVMLLPDATVRIVDFGLAKASDLNVTASRMTLGTVSYMAPEQILGRSIDARTDLWALGVVLWEMLVGHRPFAGEQEIAIAHAVLNHDPARVSQLRPGVSSEVEDIVHTLLQRDPAERFASAADVAAAIDAARSGRGVPRAPGLRTRSGVRTRALSMIGGALLLAAAAAGAWLTLGRSSPAPELRRLVVLPFAVGDAGEDQRFLSAGLSDAVRSTLAGLGGVAMPSQNSTVRYSSPPMTLAEIARALEVGTVVRGTAHTTQERVLVDIEIFDAATERTIRSRRYERPRDELLALQRDVTLDLVRWLDIALTAAERAGLDRERSVDPRAYELYLRGRSMALMDLPRRPLAPPIPVERIRDMQSLFSRAREIDPDFAPARAQLAITLMMAAGRYDTTEARREQARIEAETALRLEPGLPDAHAALSSYWSWNNIDDDRALAELQAAVQSAPNRIDRRVALASRLLGTGRYHDAVTEVDHAMRVDPTDPDLAWLSALVLLRVRRVDESLAALRRTIELDRDHHLARTILAHTEMRMRGALDTAAVVLRGIPPHWDVDGMATFARYNLLRAQRRPADALAMLDASRSELSRDGLVYQPTTLIRAQLYDDLGDSARARRHYAAARAFLLDSVARWPGNASIHGALGLTYAGLGRKADAIRHAQRALELQPVARGAAATAFMGLAAETYARAGEVDRAVELLEVLFTMPAGREVTTTWLRLWPGFDPLRADPRFEQLFQQFAVE